MRNLTAAVEERLTFPRYLHPLACEAKVDLVYRPLMHEAGDIASVWSSVQGQDGDMPKVAGRWFVSVARASRP